MDKISVIQGLIDAKKARVYLEIGVASGDCFLKITAANKIAVDPEFTIPFRRKVKRHMKRLRSVFNAKSRMNEYYYRMRSDDFFAGQNLPLLKEGLDVVFVDGLHTHEQSLSDVKNSLTRLSPGGVIVVHDCNPTTSAAAFPAASYEEARESKPEGWRGEWSGNVWKTIPYLRSTRRDLDIFVLDCDCGLGIITKRENAPALNCKAEAIKLMGYKELENEREYLLNLKPENFFHKFLGELKKRSSGEKAK